MDYSIGSGTFRQMIFNVEEFKFITSATLKEFHVPGFKFQVLRENPERHPSYLKLETRNLKLFRPSVPLFSFRRRHFHVLAEKFGELL
jgi:hypothetical protein